MKVVRLFLVVTLTVAVIRCELPEPPPPASFEIRITADGQPAAKRDISLYNEELQRKTPGRIEKGEQYMATTDAAGVARISPVLPAQYQFRVYRTSLGGNLGECTSATAGFTSNDSGQFARTAEIGESETVAWVLDIECPLRVLASEAGRFKTLAAQVPPDRALPKSNLHAKPGLAILDESGIHPLTAKLPGELRPQRADEVKTIAYIRSHTELAGFYTGGGPGMRATYGILLFDRETGALIDRTSFSSDPPASVTTLGGHPATATGRLPEREVIAWLAQQVKTPQVP